MGENVPPKPVFPVLSQTVQGFLRKKLKTVFGTPFPPQKGYIHFCRVMPGPSNSYAPKIIFRCYFRKYCFFRKSCEIKNIQNVNAYKKDYIDFCRQTTPSP